MSDDTSFCAHEKSPINTDESTTNDCTVETDAVFRRYLLNSLFRDGTHAWWTIGTVGCLSILSIVFTFFSLFLDSRNVFPALPKSLRNVTPDELRDSDTCMRMRKELRVTDETLDRVVDAARSERYIEKR